MSEQAKTLQTNPEATWTPGHNLWLIALTVTIATFMEVLDTSVANVALPHIGGGLAATAAITERALRAGCKRGFAFRWNRRRSSARRRWLQSDLLDRIPWAPTVGGRMSE